MSCDSPDIAPFGKYTNHLINPEASSSSTLTAEVDKMDMSLVNEVNAEIEDESWKEFLAVGDLVDLKDSFGKWCQV